MGKVKQSNGKAAKAAKPLTSVKSAGVTKASSTPVAKSKKLAKDVAIKALNGKDSKKSKKKVESESESSDSSENDSGAKLDSDDSDDSSDAEAEDSDSSESETEKKPAAKAAKTNGKVAAPATNGKAKKVAAAESSDSSDSSDAEEDSDDDDKDAVKKAAPAVAAGKKVAAKVESSDESEADDDSDDSDDSEADSGDSDGSEDEKEEVKKPELSKKRKADEEVSTPFKKPKPESAEEAGAATTLFVGNLGWGVNDDILYETFKECAGINSARVVTDKEMQRSRGFGYVDFDNAENCQAAFDSMQGIELEGRAMRLDPSKPRPAEDATPRDRASDRAQKHGDSVSPESDTLFVGNLPFDADEDVVSEFFGEVAEVKSLRLPTDQESGNRKGFGYITFNSVEEAKTVFEAKNGSYLGEGRGARAIRLDYASQRQPREGGGFGGGRGGGRGGGGGGFGGGFGGRGGGGRGGGRGGGFGGGRGGGGFQGKKTSFD
ncbi:hypothetical protein BJ170DRAFT_17688 [Xylariales sp. AK1849]|nr:hypothetical protein BJ170DRAFT_17688 [Xylariales sp. AK1849]